MATTAAALCGRRLAGGAVLSRTRYAHPLLASSSSVQQAAAAACESTVSGGGATEGRLPGFYVASTTTPSHCLAAALSPTMRGSGRGFASTASDAPDEGARHGTKLRSAAYWRAQGDIARGKTVVKPSGDGGRVSRCQHQFEVVGRVEADYEIPAATQFAVVEVGSHQFKVAPGDAIITEKLNGVDVNDKLSLTKVLLLGSAEETVIGRPVVPGAHVIAAVEEQFLDAKKMIFKFRRRKNSKTLKGHRQPLTNLRILEVVGMDADATVADQTAGAT